VNTLIGQSKRWIWSNRADPECAALADRHYNRQKVGSKQFVPPGRCIVLKSVCRKAVWVTSYPYAQYVKHAWAGAWVNSLFRNEGAGLSSELILEAIAATRTLTHQTWGDPPPLGIITFVDPAKVRSSNPGYCYQRAGFRHVGYAKDGKLAYQLLPAQMPDLGVVHIAERAA